MMTKLLVVLCFSTLIQLLFSVVCSQTCGLVGHDDQRGRNRESNRRFYLNTEVPASCDGTVTSWQYCYYPPSVEDAEEYEAAFAMYRQMGSSYERVTDMFRIVIPGDEIEDDFTCQTFLTPEVQVQQGDMIGVCSQDVFPDMLTRAQLIIVGRGEGTVEQIRRTSPMLATEQSTICNIGQPSYNVIMPNSISTGFQQQDRVLHLYANIIPPVTTPEITMVTITSGPSNDPAGLIGGVVTTILVILLAIVGVTIVVIVVWKRKESTKSQSLQNITRNETSAAEGINNITYEPFTDKAKTEATTTTGIAQPQEYHETSELASHTYAYEYTSSSPYQEVMNSNSNVYESPLDAAAISYSALLEKNKTEDIYGELDPYRAPPSLEDEIYRHLRTHGITNIPRSTLESSSHLGSGQFGNVEQGWWKRHGNGGCVPVALKTLNKGSLEEEKVKFLQEAAIMAQFKHPNVIKLYGVVSKGEPITLVVELAQKGDLRHYLHSIRPDPGELPPAHLPSLLLNFSQQVALGMQYLAGKGYVHRDLAARNILVTENKICKVADFGMSRDLADENYYVSHGGKIPVKWTAPEALNFKKYSTASDVWSYGCLLYEIWSLGHKPFEGIMNMEAITIVDSGRRLSPPPGCPRIIYSLMMQCWHPETARRPSFRNLVLSQVGDKNAVLSIPQEALETHQLAGVLGASLATGEMMYRDIQNTYSSTAHLQQNPSLNNDYEEF